MTVSSPGLRHRPLLALTILVVLGDIVIAYIPHSPWMHVLPVLAFLVGTRLLGFRLRGFGFRLRWEGGIRYWLIATLVIGACVGVVAAAGCYLLLPPTGSWWWCLSPPLTWADFLAVFPWVCVYAPIVEEAVYRGMLCPVVEAWLGRWAAILVSGAAFIGLHAAHGSLSPDNVVAGFFLAWAFLRSRSLLCPIALHAAGNGIIYLLHVVLPYVVTLPPFAFSP